MNQTQILTIALSTVPTMLTVLVGILINNARLGDLSGNMNARLNDMNARITDTNARISELRSHMDARFEEMKDLWRSELHRVEEVIDARLKHIEGR
jgi:flagellar capping protein FliD